MIDNELIAIFGNQEKQVSLTQPNGASGSIHLTIDKLYQGQFVNYNGQWELRLQDPTSLPPEDIAILNEFVKKHYLQL